MIPLLLRMTKSPAVPRVTGAGPLPRALEPWLAFSLTPVVAASAPHPATSSAESHINELNELLNLVIFFPSSFDPRLPSWQINRRTFRLMAIGFFPG